MDDEGRREQVARFLEVTMRARRFGKLAATKAVMQPYLDRGDHVHYGSKICYNGGASCLPYVERQVFTGPKAEEKES